MILPEKLVKLIIFIIVIALISVFSGYIKFFFKRLSAKRKIKKICKKKNYVLNVNGSWFGNFKNKDAEIFIETEKNTFAVKLIGALHKSAYDITDENTYRTKWLLFWRMEPSREYTVRKKEKFDFGEARNGKINIILFNPVPPELTYKTLGTGNSDHIGEGFLYNITGFLKLLSGESDIPQKRNKKYGE